MRLYNLVLLTLALIFSTSSLANPYIDALPAWQSTLNRYVDDQGRIDFRSLAGDTKELDEFVSAIAQISPDSHPAMFPTHADKLSYQINSYNALAMRGVIDRDIPANFSSLLKRASFFLLRSVVIGGKKTNLYDYENKVIRKMGDARIHFVLNCMVVDCPPLLKKVFKPETLDSDLEQATVDFFNSDKYVQVNSDKQQVWLSRLLKFYTKDYVESGKKQELISYVNQYRDMPLADNYKVKFLDYDWTINQQPKPFTSKLELASPSDSGT